MSGFDELPIAGVGTPQRPQTAGDEVPAVSGARATSKKPAEILREAAATIEARAVLRDRPDGERSMERAVDAFNGLTGGNARLTELEGWLFMCCLKMARATAGTPHEDDFTDLAGYAALAAECSAASAS